jgi:serine/threonine protein kinase
MMVAAARCWRYCPPRVSPAALDRLAHQYELERRTRRCLSARPLVHTSEGGRTALLLGDHGGEPLHRLIVAPMEVERFLRLAIGIVGALGKTYRRGLVHKDVKPANIIVNCAEGRLADFGIASCLPRERPAAGPPEFIAGTLSYIAPEQTGRMNCCRSRARPAALPC